MSAWAFWNRETNAGTRLRGRGMASIRVARRWRVERCTNPMIGNRHNAITRCTSRCAVTYARWSLC